MLIEPLSEKQYNFSKGFYYLIEKDYDEYDHSREILDDIVEKDVVDQLQKLADGEITTIDETLTYKVDGNPQNEKIVDWDLVYSKIPEYRLYDGWREVFSEAKAKGIKIAIVSTAKKDLIQRTLKHFQLDCDVIVGRQRCF